MRSLEGYINRVYTDFENDLEKMDSLCAITTLNYQNGFLPNYTDIHVQQLYLLKYAYAYAYEYYLMYNKAVRDLGISGRVSVASLGCGAMVDYMGLVSLKDSRPLEISYTGVDRVDWSYKPEVCAEDQVSLNVWTTIDDYLRDLEELKEDIYMFPKSISELSMEEVAHISDCFRCKRNQKDRFSICISLRKSDMHLEEDLRKAEMIQSAVTAGGYTQGVENNCFFYIPEDCGIKKIEKNYSYPDKAVEVLKGLGNRCRAKYHCGCRPQCVAGMNRYPMLRTREICYKVMIFERRCA